MSPCIGVPKSGGGARRVGTAAAAPLHDGGGGGAAALLAHVARCAGRSSENYHQLQPAF